jgi:hypothetical protein
MALVYITFVIALNISWLVKRKNIKFSKIKFSIIFGIFYWGIFIATLMNLFTNIPFKLYDAIISYIIFMASGFIWGIITYTLNNIIMKRKEKKKIIDPKDA